MARTGVASIVENGKLYRPDGSVSAVSSAVSPQTCIAELAVAAGTAIQSAVYIVQNAPKYPAAVVSSAQTVLSRWSGTGVAMPITMAIEFIGVLFAI
jgi:hypothetical protein